jgi:hypothetical protein
MSTGIQKMYEDMQKELGMDQIGGSPALDAQTPYSNNGDKNPDTSVINDDKLEGARGGKLNSVLYSSTVQK